MCELIPTGHIYMHVTACTSPRCRYLVARYVNLVVRLRTPPHTVTLELAVLSVVLMMPAALSAVLLGAS
jgi:hypothetical protein